MALKNAIALSAVPDGVVLHRVCAVTSIPPSRLIETCWGSAQCVLLARVYGRVVTKPGKQKALSNALFVSDSFFSSSSHT